MLLKEVTMIYIVAYLIEELQCDLSYTSGEEKVTPLHAAAASGHLDVIRYLDHTDKKMQSSSQAALHYI